MILIKCTRSPHVGSAATWTIRVMTVCTIASSASITSIIPNAGGARMDKPEYCPYRRIRHNRLHFMCTLRDQYVYWVECKDCPDGDVRD